MRLSQIKLISLWCLNGTPWHLRTCPQRGQHWSQRCVVVVPTLNKIWSISSIMKYARLSKVAGDQVRGCKRSWVTNQTKDLSDSKSLTCAVAPILKNKKRKGLIREKCNKRRSYKSRYKYNIVSIQRKVNTNTRCLSVQNPSHSCLRLEGQNKEECLKEYLKWTRNLSSRSSHSVCWTQWTVRCTRVLVAMAAAGTKAILKVVAKQS